MQERKINKELRQQEGKEEKKKTDREDEMYNRSMGPDWKRIYCVFLLIPRLLSTTKIS
jgi:hypothetical protein